MKYLENKIPPPVVAGVFATIMWGISLITPTFELNQIVRATMLVVLLVLAVMFIFIAIFTFTRVATTVNPLKPNTASLLVSTGIYRISRNPMYVGVAIFLMAWAVYLSSAWALIGVIGFVIYINRFQIEPEERALMEIFGLEFENYKSKVRRWL